MAAPSTSPAGKKIAAAAAVLLFALAAVSLFALWPEAEGQTRSPSGPPAKGDAVPAAAQALRTPASSGDGAGGGPSGEAYSGAAPTAPPEGAALPGRGTEEAPSAAFHIGLVTHSDDQGTDFEPAVNAILEEYGAAHSGGIILHALFPQNFLAEFEETKAVIQGMADDPLLKALIVFEGVPGTTEAFREIKARRPDILLYAAESHEEASRIAEAADLVTMADFVSRGYLLPWSAKKLGAQTFVHASFPRHMINESIVRRRNIMEESCKDLGLRFAYEEAPDPQSEGGVEAAKEYIARIFPQWLKRYGKETAFFPTNNAHTGPLIAGIIREGGYMPESDEPSPLMGYPEALEMDPASLAGSRGEIFARIEEAVVSAGGGGRLGTWTESLAASHLKALTRFAHGAVTGKHAPNDARALLGCYDGLSEDVRWNGSALTAPDGREYPNFLLVYQDTYIFGRGHIGSTDVEVPKKYSSQPLYGSPGRGSGAAQGQVVALLTGSREQGSEDPLGAEMMVRRHGAPGSGALLRHSTYPDEYINDQGAVSDLVESLADDPKVRVIVVNQAFPGTAEGFRRVKGKRPEVFCLSGEPHEPPEAIARAADLVVACDDAARGYLLPYAARELGAKAVVHVSFPRHMSHPAIRLRAAVMERACRDLGLSFFMESAPDPLGPEGAQGARAHVAENYPRWLARYGADTLFFPTNDAITEPVIAGALGHGGYFLESDIPSALLGYPEALGLDPLPFLGRWPELIRAMEREVVARGGSGRLGTWAYPMGFTQSAGLAEFGRLLAEGRAEAGNVDSVLESLGLFSPGARWAGNFLTDPSTGGIVRNYLQVYQDIYVFGKGYIETTKVDVPAEYLAMSLGE
ncbi:MAG: DUF3798 domain-containing protein [Deltaproteobacteria bacterium]|jgi:hypothetical protein|nr:DUF3798 domain-containing protein [Deltaproteobacteria bacterium]